MCCSCKAVAGFSETTNAAIDVCANAVAAVCVAVTGKLAPPSPSAHRQMSNVTARESVDLAGLLLLSQLPPRLIRPWLVCVRKGVRTQVLLR